MQPVESRILSVLRPGDMLRFILRPDQDGKIHFEIEGAQCGGTPGLLAERLQLILKALRGKGLLFSSINEPPAKNGATPRSRKQQSGRWFSLRPRAIEAQPRENAHLGFGEHQKQAGSKEGILLPDLPFSPGPSLFGSPASLLAQTREIDAMEIEFTRVELPPECVEPLGRVMRLHETPLADYRSQTRDFLGLWIAQRSGWKIQLRALVKRNLQPPVATLEIIGREIFGCECEVEEKPGFRQGTLLDLVACHPKGWPLPAILPSPDLFEAVAAERLHNGQLPRLPEKGMPIGIAENREIRLPVESRDRHTCLLGATGTGKTTLMGRMICDDIKRGEGVILIDPHGDLYQQVLESVQRNRRKDVFKLDPASEETPPGLNILDIPPGRFRQRHVNFLIGELLRFFAEMWDMQVAGGPSFEMYFRNTLLLLCMQEKELTKHRFPKEAAGELAQYIELEKQRPPIGRLNIGDFVHTMSDATFRNRLLDHCSDPNVVAFWKEIATKTSGDQSLSNYVPYITSKINGLTQSGFVSQLLCAERNEFRLGERMDRGEIILLNLNKGLLGTYESRLLGTLLTMEIFAAGLKRSLRPQHERRPVNIYVDEFQNFVSDNVASMLSEARKFGLRMTMGLQTLSQLRANRGRQDLLETVLGNVGNMILFRMGAPDAERLSLFLDPFSKKDMQELPNYHAFARILTPEGPLRPLVMRTFPG